jgi:glycosyltransferase involved in cell wall biosynthesis
MMAYACEPEAGGEPSVGWYWAENAARRGHEVIVVTRSNNREAVEHGLMSLPVDVASRMSFIYHDLGNRMLAMKGRASVFSLLGYYYVWQISVARRIRSVIRQEKIDLLHHVTFCNDAVFSVLGLFRKPFLLGPTGGYTHTVPRHLADGLGENGRKYERRRRVLQFSLRYLDPLSLASRAHATRILTYSEEARAAYRGKSREKTEAIRHVGVRADSVASMTPELPPRKGALQAISVGRLVHWKGFDLAIEAVAMANQRGGDVEFTIVGSGPEETRLRELAIARNSEHSVRFAGRLPSHRDVLDRIADADIFLQPTLRDGPPVAILEAMSLGTLVITADFGANAELVPSDCGLVVKDRKDRDQLISDLAEALLVASDNCDSMHQRTAKCLNHIRQHRTWEAIGIQQERVYRDMQQVLGI